MRVVALADLYNCRDDDLCSGGTIARGDIVPGKCGIAVAAADVPGLSVTRGVVPYQPNRCVKWQDFYLTCMALKGLREGPVPFGAPGGLRHSHYVVAELTAPAAIALAKHQLVIQTKTKGDAQLRLVETSDGRKLVNLEVARIPEKNPGYRRAELQ
jgi:hypothetical protein